MNVGRSCSGTLSFGGVLATFDEEREMPTETLVSMWPSVMNHHAAHASYYRSGIIRSIAP